MMVIGYKMLLSAVIISHGQTIRTIGGSGANYSTLKQAFDNINNGTITGTILLQVTGSTTEAASATLNASGSGSASYSSVLIFPTVSRITISGTLTAPLIDLNGADNVTIDGRVNHTGITESLTIVNQSTSSTSGTSTIRFINDATTNDIKYCNLKGSSLSAYDGIICLSTALVTGNDNNFIQNNRITNHNGNRPVNSIFAQGTSYKPNENITVSNNRQHLYRKQHHFVIPF
jgi:hypothetical protein